MTTIEQLRGEHGFTLIELMVASVCTVIVLGSAVALTSQIQSGYRRQIEDSVAEQEARYALDWIGRYLRSAGNNPLNAPPSPCSAVDPDFQAIIPDPDGNTVHNDITLMSDNNPPDKNIGGANTAQVPCNQANEHVTIRFNSGTNSIEFRDNGVGATAATTRTDSVIQNLQFTYLDSNRAPWNGVSAANIFYVRTIITVRTRTMNASTGQPTTRTMMSEIRVRGR